MLGRNSTLGLIWRSYSLIFIFMVFMGFSSENAGSGFYQRYYLFMIVMCLLSILPYTAGVTSYIKQNSSNVFLFIYFLAIIISWNFIVSGFTAFYSFVILIVAFIGATIFVMGQVRPWLMVRVIRTIILINLAGLIYQFLVFALTGDVPYLHGDLFPFSRDRYQLVILGGFERFSGLQLEPGSYSTMITLALIYYRSLTNKIDRTFVIGTISVMLTFATIAMMYVAILCFVILVEVRWSKPRNLFWALAGFSGLISVLIFGGIIDIIMSRFDGGYQGDSSLNYKILNLISYTQFSGLEILTGLGIGNIYEDCVGCDHVKSNGLIFYMVYNLGIFGFIFILALAVKAMQNGATCFLFALILLLCRYPPIMPIFWVTFLCLWNWPRKPMAQPNPDATPTHNVFA